MNLRLGRFGLQESTAVVFLSALVSGVFSVNVSQTYDRGNVCYAATLAGTALAALLLLLLMRAMEKQGAESLGALLKTLWGRMAPLVGLSWGIGLVLAGVLPLFRFTLAMERYIYVEANYLPMGTWLLPVVLLLTVLGMECIARVSKILFIPAVLALVLTLILASPAFALHHLYPLLSSGFLVFLRQTGESLLRFLPGGLGLLAAGEGCQGLSHAKKSVTWGTLLGGAAAGCMQFGLGLTFFSQDLAGMVAPVYCMTMAARQERLALRLDVLVLFLWVLAGLAVAAFLAYGASLLFVTLFEGEDIRPIAALTVLILICLLMLVNFDAEPIQRTTAAAYRWGYWLLLAPVLAALGRSGIGRRS